MIDAILLFLVSIIGLSAGLLIFVLVLIIVERLRSETK